MPKKFLLVKDLELKSVRRPHKLPIAPTKHGTLEVKFLSCRSRRTLALPQLCLKCQRASQIPNFVS